MKKLIIILLCTRSLIDKAQTPYPPAPPAPVNITAMEYFIDNFQDPGNATPLTGFTPSTNINGFNGSVNVSGLLSGFHRIYIRSKDANGIWSFTNHSFFDNYNIPVYASAPPAPGNITNMEYFIDTFKTFDNGTSITGITPAQNISNFNTNLNITGLFNGFHRFYIRSKEMELYAKQFF